MKSGHLNKKQWAISKIWAKTRRRDIFFTLDDHFSYKKCTFNLWNDLQFVRNLYQFYDYNRFKEYVMQLTLFSAEISTFVRLFCVCSMIFRLPRKWRLFCANPPHCSIIFVIENVYQKMSLRKYSLNREFPITFC